MLLLKATLIAGLLLTDAMAGEDTSRYLVPVDEDGVQRVQVIASEYFFEPEHIVVKAKLPVEMSIVKKPGIVPHKIVIAIPGQGVNINESLTYIPSRIRFTIKETGKYSFYCDNKLLFFKNHKEKGMTGIIEVLP